VEKLKQNSGKCLMRKIVAKLRKKFFKATKTSELAKKVIFRFKAKKSFQNSLS
jgi:hypothetical protein